MKNKKTIMMTFLYLYNFEDDASKNLECASIITLSFSRVVLGWMTTID